MSAHELEDDRPRRRDRACVVTGLLAGGVLGTLAGGVVLAVIGAVAGGVAGKAIALRISADEWDPLWSPRPYVGTKSPDDDITSQVDAVGGGGR